MKEKNIRKLTIAGVLVAVAVVGSLFSIPVFGAKCSPVQHMVNVLGAVLLGPGYAVGMAFAAALIRNLLGLGSLLAFPGSMIGALLCGVSYAKGIAYRYGLPLIPVHHIEGHISAAYLAHEDLEPPFLALVVSGGHSHLVLVKDYGAHEILGRTRDDAAGEAFDKAARVLGLPYPGGPTIDKLAMNGDDHALPLPKARQEGYNYSFSGLKTALLQAVARAEKQGSKPSDADIAASFRRAVVEQLIDKAELALHETGVKKLVLAGGVACNSLLRSKANEACQRNGAKVFLPPPILCTDNAAMIGCAGYYRLRKGNIADMTLNAIPSMPLPKA